MNLLLAYLARRRIKDAYVDGYRDGWRAGYNHGLADGRLEAAGPDPVAPPGARQDLIEQLRREGRL